MTESRHVSGARILSMALCLLLVMMVCRTANAGPSSHRIKREPGLFGSLFDDSDDDHQTVKKRVQETHHHSPASKRLEPTINYDGIWVDQNKQTVLTKKVHRSLFLSGSNDSSAWQAQCVVANAIARCVGSGISEMNGEFNYQSDLRMENNTLQVDWKFEYSNGQSNTGQSVYGRFGGGR